MRALDRKVLGDLVHMRAQMLAIAIVIVAGVATYVSMQSIQHALMRTLADYYREYRFADGFANVRRAPETLRPRLAAVPGLAELQTRVTAPVTFEIANFAEPVSGKLVSVPDGREPELNRRVLRRGRYLQPGHPDEVLANEVFADAHHFRPGDKLRAIINGRRRTLTIVGIALSPEYLMQVQPGTLFPDPVRYGVLWMNRQALAAAYDMQGAFNDLSFTVAPGADTSDVIKRVDLLLARYGGLGAMPRRDQPSNFMISEEFRQLRTTSTVLPFIFIAVAAFLLNIVVSRLISLQREQIGVLKAFGYSNVDVGLHYLKLVLAVVLAGAIAGTGLGLYLSRLLGLLYLSYYRFPEIKYAASLHTIPEALVLTCGAVVLGTLQAVRRAVRLPPATAMREAVPPLYRASRLESFGLKRLLDQPTRMMLRSMTRRPSRTLFTIAGIGSACAILIMGLFFGDSFAFVMRVQYGLAERENLTVTFAEPTSTRALYELAALPGVEQAEPFRSVPVRLRYGHRRYDTTIEGAPPRAQLRRIINADLQPVSLPREGLVLSERLAHVLHVQPGDSVVVDVREGTRDTRTLAVTALTRQYIGIAAYMNLDALNRLAGNGAAISGAYLLTDRHYDAVLNAQLERRPRIASIVSTDRLMAAFTESYDRSLLTMAFILTLFAGAIAFGVVYNSARISLSERDRELASLRVLGFTRGEISYILLGELAVLTLLAIPMGFGIGALFSSGMARGLETDLYQFPLVIGRRTLGLAALVVLISAAISAALVRVRLNRLDLVGVLKTRE